MLSLIPVKAQTLENLGCISSGQVPVILFVWLFWWGWNPGPPSAFITELHPPATVFFKVEKRDKQQLLWSQGQGCQKYWPPLE